MEILLTSSIIKILVCPRKRVLVPRPPPINFVHQDRPSIFNKISKYLGLG